MALRPPLNVLDNGPTTIVGERQTLVDPVVLQLGELLEAHVGPFDQSEIEVEIRLGIVAPAREQSSTTGHVRESRVDLPCSTEAVLNRRSGFKYGFVPGLPAETFIDLSQRLDQMCNSDVPEERVECGQKFEHIVDIYYPFQAPLNDAGAPQTTGETPKLRISRRLGPEETAGEVGDTSAAGTPWRATLKKRLGQLDVYTGRRPGEHGPAFDFRVAVSSEVPLPTFVPTLGQREEMKRSKMRKTYHFRAWHIDISTVTTTFPANEQSGQSSGPPRSTQSHEVEIELDSFHLRRNLDAKLAGKPHKLWELLSDFLFTARDLAVIAAETRPLALPPVLEVQAPLRDEDHPAYRKKYSDTVEPVLGHYLYRLAAPRGEPLAQVLPEPEPEVLPEPAPPSPPPFAAAKRSMPPQADEELAAAAAVKAARTGGEEEVKPFEEAPMDEGSSSAEEAPAPPGGQSESWLQVSKNWEELVGL